MNDKEFLRAAGYQFPTNTWSKGESNSDYLNPTIWNTQIEAFAQAKTVVAPLGVQNTELLNKPGKTLNIAVNSAISAVALADTVSLTVQALDWSQVTVTPGEYGGAFQITRAELDRSFSNLLNEKSADAGYALAKVKDETILAGLVAGATTTIYANGVTNSAITSTDIFETDLIADGVKSLRVLNRDALYLVIHPYQEARLLKSSDFIDASKYGGREAIMNGEIGKYLGLRVFTTTLIPTALGATSVGSLVTMYKSLVLGPRSFVIAQKRAPTIDSEYRVLDRCFSVAYIEDWGYSVLNADEICVCASAA
jgi:N4-gp56 family major capsid protein